MRRRGGVPPFAANHDPEAEEDNGSCIYCEAVNTPNTDAPDPMVFGTGIGNTHMHVSEDSCNVISLSLGVLERYVGNLAPEGDDPTNYVIGTGLADVPEGADEGSRWNYLLSINLGEHTFADVDCLDFNPDSEIDLSDPASAYTVFGSYADAFALLGVTELIESSFFQDTQNLGFGLWADVLGGLVSFDPNAEGTYNVGLYAYAPSGALLASTEISIQTLDEGGAPTKAQLPPWTMARACCLTTAAFAVATASQRGRAIVWAMCTTIAAFVAATAAHATLVTRRSSRRPTP